MAEIFLNEAQLAEWVEFTFLAAGVMPFIGPLTQRGISIELRRGSGFYQGFCQRYPEAELGLLIAPIGFGNLKGVQIHDEQADAKAAGQLYVDTLKAVGIAAQMHVWADGNELSFQVYVLVPYKQQMSSGLVPRAQVHFRMTTYGQFQKTPLRHDVRIELAFDSDGDGGYLIRKAIPSQLAADCAQIIEGRGKMMGTAAANWIQNLIGSLGYKPAYRKYEDDGK